MTIDDGWPRLTDEEWRRVEPLLPPPKPGGRPRAIDLRRVVDAILWVLVGRGAWRHLPPGYRPWSSVYDYFRAWRRDGTWARVVSALDDRRPAEFRTSAAGERLSVQHLSLREISLRIGVDGAEARNLFARGLRPPGAASSPGKGRHRRFDPAQSFWLAIALALRKAGCRPASAAEIAGWAATRRQPAPGPKSLSRPSPFLEVLHGERRWFLEVGDGTFVRFAAAGPEESDAAPGPWTRLAAGRAEPAAFPLAVLRLNLPAIAARLNVSPGTGSESSPTARAASDQETRPPSCKKRRPPLI